MSLRSDAVTAAVSKFVLVALLASATPAFAQKITVKSATPNNGAQGTVNLDIVIDGSGFGSDSVAQFHVSGTTNPGGVKVNRTTRLSNAQVVANIDIDDLALLSYYDIKIVSNGRTGKGTDLFQVVQKGPQACSDGPLLRLVPSVVDLPQPSAGPTCEPGASGTVDCSFGVQGRVVTTNIVIGSSIAAVVQPDGKIVVLAMGRPPGATSGSGVYVLRYLADGALDMSFDGDGIRYLEFTPKLDGEDPGGLAIQPDGKIVVAAYVPLKGTVSEVAVTRLLSNGAVDSSFGSAGVVRFSYESSKVTSVVSDIALQPDGRILVTGGGGLARLNTNGTLDTSFSGDGRMLLEFGAARLGIAALDVGLQQVGTSSRIVLAGSRNGCDGMANAAIARLTADGSPDSSFGPTGEGFVLLAYGDRVERAHRALPDALGRLMIVGMSTLTEPVLRPRIAMTRLLPDGGIDMSFASGSALIGVSGLSVLPGMGLHLDEASSLLIAGEAYTTNVTEGSYLLMRVREDGQLDPGFGQFGVTLTDVGPGLDSAAVFVVQPTGRIVVIGSLRGAGAIGLVGYVP
jgi:uncharacterized delta-60 repeat protein